MKKQKSRLDAREVIHELKEDPLRKFRTAFVLMSLIPFLVFCRTHGPNYISYDCN